ncbi:MAG: cytidylate kinase-like family protein [candidate division Zixibacteria bacterium]
MASIEQIINRQFGMWEMQQKERAVALEPSPPPPPIVTVSREHGSRGSYLASRLAEAMGYQRLHREVIDSICQSSGYRKHIIESLDEKYRSNITMLVESFLIGQAVHPVDYARNLYLVILSMAELGGVVLVGRGGNFILGPEKGFHIRVVCPREKRVDNLIKYKAMEREEAIASIAESDLERKELIRKMFGQDINNPCFYDLCINTARIDIEDIVPSILGAIDGKMKKLKHDPAV